MIPDSIKGIIILLIVFVPLERLFALRPQKVFRPGWLTDLTYYLTGNLLGKLGVLLCSSALMGFLGTFGHQDIQERVVSQPLVLQLLVAIVIGDLGYYSAHRLLHTNRWLWHFHAIHHSIKDMDWLATVRVHPIDQLLAKILQVFPLYWFGFSPDTLALYLGFSAAISFFIHSNLRLKVGWVKWLIATPEFHHWHHANMPGVRNCNMAAQLPVIDWLFGTLYLPHGVMPERYGMPDSVPPSYFRQLVYPFQKIVTTLRSNIMTQPHRRFSLAQLTRPVPLMACVVLLAGVTTVAVAKANHISIKPTIISFVTEFGVSKVTAADLMAQKVKPIVLIDVRTPEEHTHEQIGQSYLVPVTEIEQGDGLRQLRQISQTSATSQAQPTFVLYCGSGPRSVQAYRALQNSDLKLVILSGGIEAWRRTVPMNQDATVLSPITLPFKGQPVASHL